MHRHHSAPDYHLDHSSPNSPQELIISGGCQQRGPVQTSLLLSY